MGKDKRKRIKVHIHNLWWTDLLTVPVKVPSKYRFRKRFRKAWSDGVAQGVAAALSALEVKSDATVGEGSADA